MKLDLTVDSQATKKYVAERILGWERKPETKKHGEYFLRPGNTWPTFPLPNFLRRSEWTGPLELELLKKAKEREVTKIYRQTTIDYSEGREVATEKIWFDDKLMGECFNLEGNLTPTQMTNIAIAQAVQAITEGE